MPQAIWQNPDETLAMRRKTDVWQETPCELQRIIRVICQALARNPSDTISFLGMVCEPLAPQWEGVKPKDFLTCNNIISLLAQTGPKALLCTYGDFGNYILRWTAHVHMEILRITYYGGQKAGGAKRNTIKIKKI